MRDFRIGIVGLGYVGLPLAVALARRYPVTGFDISERRVEALQSGVDWTNEVSPEELAASGIEISTDAAALTGCGVFIVTVPTPIDAARRPDFGALLSACALIGPTLAPGAVVVFESTVYPGVTEEICGPALEKASGLRAGVDFKLGYSPERINPGDREHPIGKIVKVVAGQDEETLERLSEMYGAVIEAGVHRASSIKVAEAAKVIENTQRDVNIALMNEISKICDLLEISTGEVLAAAGTKWNFLNFYPGLVGGHCIGVDPYYLTAKAEQLGYHPEVILSGRRVNDGMGAYVAQRLVKLLAAGGRSAGEMRVGILGLTFKENVPDVRNTKIVDVIAELKEFGVEPLVHDPIADPNLVAQAYGIHLSSLDEIRNCAAIVLAVPHQSYADFGEDELSGRLLEGGVLIEVKARIDPSALRPDIRYWSL